MGVENRAFSHGFSYVELTLNSIVLMEGDTNRKETDYQPDGILVKIGISKSTFSLTRSETL